MIKKRYITYLAILALSSLMFGCANAPQEHVASDTQAQTAFISVSARAEKNVEPDRARIRVSTLTQATSAEEAQSQNAATTNALIEALKTLGIEDKSIQTIYTDLMPLYKNDSMDIEGYEMRTGLSISDLEIERVGEIIAAAVAAGAETVDGPEYYASSYDAAYAEALTEAIHAAREKALVMADAAGASLGGVVSITEGYQNTSYRYAAQTDAISEEAADAGAGLIIAPGEISIEANVSVNYAIN